MNKVKQLSKDEVIAITVDYLQRTASFPTEHVFDELGLSRHIIRKRFGNLSSFKTLIRRLHPDLMRNIIDPESGLYSVQAKKELQDLVKKHSKFVVTTAVMGAPVDDKFLKSLHVYCEHNDSKLLVMVSKAGKADLSISPKLANETLVLYDVPLNSNLSLVAMDVNSKAVDPVVGMKRIGQRNGSSIFASPKQRLQYVATSNEKLPHALMSTGAVTVPFYDTVGIKNKRNLVAMNDHVVGAIIVELDPDGVVYHFRQVQAGKGGGFYDLNKHYSSNGVIAARPSAMVLGDYHSGSTDQTALRGCNELMDLVKPSSIILHDFFDGASINHHEEHDVIQKAIRAKSSGMDLQREIGVMAFDLAALCMKPYVNKAVMVKSNHDLFLDRYLREGKYVVDHANHYYAICLAKAMLEGEDPLKYAVSNVHLPPSMKAAVNKKVQWLTEDEDYKIAGVQLGAHGHRGSNGAKGSAATLEEAYGQVVYGHVHTPGIVRGSWAVGTLSQLRLSYNKGASSWMHAVCLVFKDGSRQLVNFIDGKYKA